MTDDPNDIDAQASVLMKSGIRLFNEESTEGAAERNKAIAPDIAAPLIAAVVKTTGIVKVETIEPIIANKKAFQMALDELHIMPLNPVAA